MLSSMSDDYFIVLQADFVQRAGHIHSAHVSAHVILRFEGFEQQPHGGSVIFSS